jgi:hypothetical protein
MNRRLIEAIRTAQAERARRRQRGTTPAPTRTPQPPAFVDYQALIASTEDPREYDPTEEAERKEIRDSYWDGDGTGSTGPR